MNDTLNRLNDAVEFLKNHYKEIDELKSLDDLARYKLFAQPTSFTNSSGEYEQPPDYDTYIAIISDVGVRLRVYENENGWCVLQAELYVECLDTGTIFTDYIHVVAVFTEGNASRGIYLVREVDAEYEDWNGDLIWEPEDMAVITAKRLTKPKRKKKPQRMYNK
jgi:hypothetical protein